MARLKQVEESEKFRDDLKNAVGIFQGYVTNRTHVDLLPKELASQIKAAAEKERALYIKEIESIDLRVEQLKKDYELICKKVSNACPVIKEPDIVRSNIYGAKRVVVGRTVKQKTQAAIDMEPEKLKLHEAIYALKKRKIGIHQAIGDILRISRACDRGVVTPLLLITEQWKNSISLGPIRKVIYDTPKIGSSQPVGAGEQHENLDAAKTPGKKSWMPGTGADKFDDPWVNKLLNS
jgi:hypothetical protein